MAELAGKKIVVGVCGSIAAFKVAGWVSTLAKEEAIVDVVMTDAAQHFVTPITFAALSGRKVHTEMFDNSADSVMSHIDLGREADLLVIAPATADTIAKLANGMADSLLTTTALVARCPVLIFPAMNTKMYQHKATRSNLEALRALGYVVIDPECGSMACKEVGEGRLVEWDIASEAIKGTLSKKDLNGLQVVITAGPTREAIDPARFLSNRSSGKMGYALARVATRRGAKVVLVSGPSTLADPYGVEVIRVESAEQMFEAVMGCSKSADIIIKSAAVADYRPKEYREHKVKKEEIGFSLEMEKNPDILKTLGKEKRPGQILVGFAAESRNLASEGRRKLREKNLDLIAVNDISSSQAGFATDTNEILLLDGESETSLPLLSKEETADRILDKVASLYLENCD